jgi:hypothetical protein
MTFEVFRLMNIKHYDVGFDTVQWNAEVFKNVWDEPAGQNLYQSKEDGAQNFSPKTGRKRLFREIREDMLE